MNRASGLRIAFVLTVSAALMIMPNAAFARGGHGGGGFGGHGGGFGGHGGGFGGHGGGFGGHGGGFGGHGGGFGGHGGGFGGHGGGFGGHGGGFGGHGGGFGGHRGGFGGSGGFRHGFGGFGERGFGGFDRGFDFDFDFFPFFPYWGFSPYGYGYGPWWGAPYPYYSPYYSPYPYYNNYGPYDGPDDPDYYRYRRDYPCRPDYRHADLCNDSSPDNYEPNRGSAQPSNLASPESYPDPNFVTNQVEDYRKSIHTTTPGTDGSSNFHLASSSAQAAPSQLRPAVRNAIQALRAMPAGARERQLSSGRYGSFSAEERAVLNQALARSGAQ